jgi:hypothetical protein
MSERFAEFSVHGDANADAWLWHEPCRTELPAIDDPWSLAELVASAHRHLAACGVEASLSEPGYGSAVRDRHGAIYAYSEIGWWMAGATGPIPWATLASRGPLHLLVNGPVVA